MFGGFNRQRAVLDRLLMLRKHPRVIVDCGNQIIHERVALLIDLVQKGRTDPEIVMLARECVSKRCGSHWCIGERDWRGEIVAVHVGVVGIAISGP